MDNKLDNEKLEKKKKRYKKYMKLNIMSLFFAATSFISITLAWFAYSGLITTRTEIDVKAWYIEFKNQGKEISNNIVIPLSTISPGMDTISETINIKNLGDSDASLSYEISSVRILDEILESNGDEGYIEDQLAHNYPFQINISLSDSYANANDGTGEFVVSVSWPLDGGDDKADNDWGREAYLYQQNNPDKPSIEISINLKAVQYLGDSTSSDTDYRLGNIVLYNPTTNTKCTEISSSCLKTYVIDKDSKIGDTKVTLMPDLSTTELTQSTGTNYQTELTTLPTKYSTSRALKAEDVLPIISKDIINTIVMRRNNLSNIIVGNLNYNNRVETHINKTITENGIYRFTTLNFMYFSTQNCIWLNTNYGTTYQFALNKIDNTYSKLYNESKDATCSIVPVFEVLKNNLK